MIPVVYDLFNITVSISNMVRLVSDESERIGKEAALDSF
jgi:hypothetical protein